MSWNSLDQEVAHIRRIFKELDDDVAVFQRACGFGCLKACGHCCQNPLVEATELEMLPLAAALLEEGKAADPYARAEKKDFKGRCIFFEPELGPGVPGHCRVYEYRPLICRLFSASGNKDKAGNMRLVVCGPLKQAQSGAVERAQAQVLAGRLSVPVMADHAMRVMAVNAGSACKNLPVNMAFKKAVDRVSLSSSLRDEGRPRV